MSDKMFDFNSGFVEAYDNFVRQSIFGYEQIFSMVTALLKDRLPTDANLLVGGCGTGMELVTFGTKMPGWRMTGFDPSEQMMSIAKAKVEQHGLGERVRLVHGYATDLPEGESYDAATLMLVLHFIPDVAGKLSLLKTVSSHIKSGGSLVYLSHHGDTADPDFKEMLNGWRDFIIHNGVSAKNVDNVLQTALTGGQFSPENMVLTLLEQAGFSDIKRFYNAFLTSGWIARKA
ncbi:MAG: class I SAM-dependent methyltransferase [Chloroflexi bacterium]|uniref:Class I SAM-dependent methyltransferase n=1 Tax=Candidatus Chlorohelix allophototropha TaxID=3003348 RepID=A0A8T7M153_9CHLR|nr:class I SAM-dependent methyltransferase [Chloroflexota bacterium]WJW66239.1 class I SAM-dependent methyltransferase [Chloroflexota bacterium L227-S17]